MAIRGAQMNIANGIREFARATPRAPAVIDGERILEYAALDDRSSRLANSLLATGLNPGDRVALLSGNRLEYPEVAAALAKAGLPMVPLNPRSAPPEIEFILGHSGAAALIIDDALAETAAPGVDRHGIRNVLSIDGTSLGPSYERAIEDARPVDPKVEVDETEHFAIAYTSGTTGDPKGVMISHRSRALVFMAAALEWGMGPGRRTIAVAPMYHGAGFAFAYVAVFTGGTVSMLRAFDPEKVLAMVERDRAESVFLVPTHAQMIRSLGEEAIHAFDLSSWDVVYFNAAPLPQELKVWVLDTFDWLKLHEVYGSTEGGVVTDLRPPDAVRKERCVGQPWFMTEVRVWSTTQATPSNRELWESCTAALPI